MNFSLAMTLPRAFPGTCLLFYSPLNLSRKTSYVKQRKNSCAPVLLQWFCVYFRLHVVANNTLQINVLSSHLVLNLKKKQESAECHEGLDLCDKWPLSRVSQPSTGSLSDLCWHMPVWPRFPNWPSLAWRWCCRISNSASNNFSPQPNYHQGINTSTPTELSKIFHEKSELARTNEGKWNLATVMKTWIENLLTRSSWYFINKLSLQICFIP